MAKITGPGVPSHSGHPAETEEEVPSSPGTNSSTSSETSGKTPDKHAEKKTTRKPARTTENRFR